MKIAIDGFALGIRKGTGLTTYARELAGTLVRGGHQVDVIFGVNGVGTQRGLLRSRFLQSLAIQGEPEAFAWRQWAPHLPPYLVAHAVRYALRPRAIPWDTSDEAVSMPEGLAGVHRVFNLASVHRVAQATAGMLGTGLRIRRPAGVEVYHRTSPLPIRMEQVANVVTVHDVIPLVFPQSTAINLLQYRRIMQASLRSADGIFVVSEHSRGDLLKHFDIPEERVHVTYQAVQVPETLLDVDPNMLDQYLDRAFGLRAGGYLLFHGAIEPKKNLMRVLDGYQRARTDLPLVVVGKKGWLFENEVKRLKQAKKLRKSGEVGGLVRHIDYVPFGQLMRLIKGARAVVFPSLYEGFGLPVLEAMQLGTPVITSATGALKEVAADAARLVDPLDVDGIARAIDDVSMDDTLCVDLAVRGRRRAEYFSPQRHHDRLEAAYQQVLK